MARDDVFLVVSGGGQDMTIDDRRRKEQEAEEKREGDLGEGSFSQTHQGQPPPPPNVKGPRHVPIPSKDKAD